MSEANREERGWDKSMKSVESVREAYRELVGLCDSVRGNYRERNRKGGRGIWGMVTERESVRADQLYSFPRKLWSHNCL